MSHLDKAFSFVGPLREWLELDAEDQVMTLVEDPSFSDWVRQALHALNIEAQVADEARTVRMISQRGFGNGWARFDTLARWAEEQHDDRERLRHDG